MPEPVQDILGPLAQPDLGLLNIKRTEVWPDIEYKIFVFSVKTKLKFHKNNNSMFMLYT